MARILLVEDDIELSEGLRDWLVHNQHTVEMAHDGYEAMENLRFSEYDIIMLDWQLPGITGLEICKQFRGSGGTTPILMLTGMTSSAQREEVTAAGATACLIKPFKLKELTAKIDQILAAAPTQPPT